MFTLAAWLHTIDPVIVRFSDFFAVRWYGLSYVVGFIIAYLILKAFSARGLVRIPQQHVIDAVFWIVGGTIVGGRLGYCLVYQRHLLMEFYQSFPFWGVLAINKGGMASHGGMVGLAIACLRISKGWDNQSGNIVGRCSVLHVMDSVALVAPFGLFLGRLANFINGELLGAIVTRPGTQGPWWSVQYPQELNEDYSKVPALQDPATAARLMDLAERAAPGKSLEAGLYQLSTHAKQHAPELHALLASRHPSQLYQALAEGVVLGAVLWFVWRVPRRPGIVTGWFFIVYGLLRVITEIWRLPDAHFEDGRPWGLSRGQWLSLPMVVIGAGLLWWASRRSVEKLGGWLKAS